MTAPTAAAAPPAAAPAGAAAGRRLPLAIPVGIGAAWLLTVALVLAGKADLLHHDVVADGGLPAPVALGLFLVGWQVMLAAMMLPSTVPLLRRFRAAAASQDHPGRVLGAFVAGYAVVWGAFGSAAMAADLALHRLVHATPWLEARPWLVAGAVLVGAGAFQFTDLKDRCLSQCRHPAMWLLRRYRRGVGAAFRLGRDHGVFCLGCCWALMLLMFAAGVANIVWMGGLAVLMAYEKVGRHGRAAARAAGAALVMWGAAVLLQLAWLPAGVLGGA